VSRSQTVLHFSEDAGEMQYLEIGQRASRELSSIVVCLN